MSSAKLRRFSLVEENKRNNSDTVRKGGSGIGSDFDMMPEVNPDDN